ncbi:serine/threonine protein kinase [Vibrio splendidus]|uniref:serine/threonine protein kinase n=1 Tax=Vibrio splendidus TaxID=29497 RepID=UPI000E3253A5|nr:serine/threonine protein kinase [Vibrio splendidus]
MKYKILALSVVGAILGGCGSDNNNSVPPEQAYRNIMAFDPAVMGMKGTYSCDNGATGSLEETNYHGVSEVTDLTVLNYPETCTFTYNATPGAKDVSNGKDMSKVSYKFPKGLANYDDLVTSSPISTLIEKELDGAAYNEATGIQVLKDLGLDSLLNNGSVSSVADFLRRTDEVIKTLPASEASLVSATAAVLSDVLVVSPTATANELAAATESITQEVIATYPEYPKASGGDEIYLDLKEDPTLIEDAVKDPGNVGTLPPPKDSEPVPDPDGGTPPPTGGTGGTGAGGAGGGTGG